MSKMVTLALDDRIDNYGYQIPGESGEDYEKRMANRSVERRRNMTEEDIQLLNELIQGIAPAAKKLGYQP